jgi:hypothetical protein
MWVFKKIIHDLNHISGSTNNSLRGIYPMHSIPRTYCACEITKFKKSEELFIYNLSIIFHICIQFQVQIPYNLTIIKMRNF